MKIKLDTYNLKEARLKIIKKCIKQNPNLNGNQIAELLGIDIRTLQNTIWPKSFIPKH